MAGSRHRSDMLPKKTVLGWAIGVEIVLAILVLINRRPFGDIVLMVLMGAVAIGAVVALVVGDRGRHRDERRQRARQVAHWERRTTTEKGKTRIYLVRVARFDGEVEEFGPADQVGHSISTGDPDWQSLMLAREAEADERLFFLNR